MEGSYRQPGIPRRKPARKTMAVDGWAARRALWLLLLAAGVHAAPAQEVVRPLTLGEAETIALGRAPALQVAVERSRAAEAQARAAGSFRYPSLELRTGWLRSDDPVAAFGTKLRQQRFQEADFALSTLNDPPPVTDWTAGAGLTWRALDPTAWAARAAGREAAAAADWSAERARTHVLFRTRALYYRIVQAEARVGAAEAAVEAGRATVQRFTRRREEGLLTRADALQAEAELAAAEARLAGVRQLRDEARLELGLHLGWAADSVPGAADALPPVHPLAPLPEDGGRTARRSDLRALEARVRSAEASLRGARHHWFPAFEAFAGYQKHADAPFASDGTQWSIGLGLRWTAFDGLAREARAEVAMAKLRAARVEYEDALRSARVEARLARQAVESTLTALTASEAAWRAAAEGRELMRRRFEEGLAGATDLLAAEARAAELEARAIDALGDHHVARARLRFALESWETGATVAEPWQGEP